VTVVIVSFFACLAVFTAIGLLSERQARPTTEDYLVASRNVPAWLTALSSVATNNSGFMFIGLLGFTYRFGVQAIWLQLGWIVGDVVCWLWIHRRVRQVSGELAVSSIPELLATRDDHYRSTATAIVAGLLTLIFLAGYAAAQLNAGGTALHVLFGWERWLGAVIGAVIVVAYCFAGGIRASIWTDAAQAFVMLGSMAALLVFAVAEVGGPGALLDALEAADASLVQWLPDDLAFGFGLYFIGFIFGGLGAIGQPHILIRTMAIRSANDIPRARSIYFLWYIPFSISAVAAGLYTRVLLPELLAGIPAAEAAAAAELALPELATLLLPSVLLGMLLAGVFAATMSTADSQILACSAAVTQDIYPTWRRSYIASKIATVSVTAVALAIAVWGGQTVFSLVLGAWSALGSTIGPLLILRVWRYEIPGPIAVVMMAAGIATVTLWDAAGYTGALFKLAPGMAVPFALFAVARIAGFVQPRRVATR
jgi:sodium/proline symporter